MLAGCVNDGDGLFTGRGLATYVFSRPRPGNGILPVQLPATVTSSKVMSISFGISQLSVAVASPLGGW